jgi:hypothetical protein
LANPVDSPNGRAFTHVLQNQGLTGLLGSSYPQEMVQRDLRHDTRLRIFSGSANPSLAQVSSRILCFCLIIVAKKETGWLRNINPTSLLSEEVSDMSCWIIFRLYVMNHETLCGEVIAPSIII